MSKALDFFILLSYILTVESPPREVSIKSLDLFVDRQTSVCR